MSPLQPGRLRHKVQLLAQGAGQDAFGQPTGFATYAAPWAAIDALQGRELYQAQQYVSAVTHKVTIRYLPGVRAHHRVQFGLRAFSVQAVLNPQERNIELDLLCVEINDGQN